MKKLLIVASILLLGVVGCTPNKSSSLDSFSSSEPNSVISDTRTAKEKILDICDIIIENADDETLVSTTQTLNGNITLTNMDSTASIYYSNKITLSDFVVESISENIVDTETNKTLYNIKGVANIVHKEEYWGSEEDIELKNFNEEYTFNESIMIINDNLYCDLSEQANSLFDDNQISASPDLKLKQENLSTIIEELMEEYYPDFDSSNIEIPEIDPNELLQEFVGEDSLFNDYLKYVEEENTLKLKLTLKPADFNELINDLLLEYDPESTIPISTIIQMESNNSSKFEIIFNFSSDNIASMDINIDGKFNLFADSYILTTKLQGSVVNNEVDAFVPLDGYESFVNFSDANIDIKQEIKDIIDSIIPIVNEENDTNE